MTRNWLYPLSRNAGTWFVDTDGNRTPDTCFGCFVHMNHSKKTDDDWISQPPYHRSCRWRPRLAVLWNG